MPADLNTARALFLHAVGQLPPADWDAYVATACAGDADLEQFVQHLLQVHREAGSFLEQPAVALPTAALPAATGVAAPAAAGGGGPGLRGS